MVRKAALNDFWRKISNMQAYNQYIEKLSITDNFLFKSFSVDMSAKIISICGKNGIGKTSLLKIIYTILTKNDCNLDPQLKEEIRDCNITMMIRKNQSTIVESDKNKILGIEYFDASNFCYISRKVLGNDIHQNDLINYATYYLFEDKYLYILNRITSKYYIKVKCYEIAGVDDTNETYPYFEVCLKNGLTYSSTQMGAGEHKIFIIVWKIINLEKNTILLLEEPETFLCPLSQKRLLEFFVEYIELKRLQIILSTHSEHILKNQSINTIKFLRKVDQDKHELITATDNVRYFIALGLTPAKNNIFLVEDKFAKSVLEEILRLKAEDLYMTSFIHPLDGESNIKKVSKHYVSQEGLNFVAVYDADQISSDNNDKIFIPKVFLPAMDNHSPEKEIINSISRNIPKYAERLKCDDGLLSAAIQDNQCDPHDFFSELSHDNPDLPKQVELEVNAIRLWLSLNNDLIERFILELRKFIKKT